MSLVQSASRVITFCMLLNFKISLEDLFVDLNTLPTDLWLPTRLLDISVDEVEYTAGFKEDPIHKIELFHFDSKSNLLFGFVDYSNILKQLYPNGEINTGLLKFNYKYRVSHRLSNEVKMKERVKLVSSITEDNKSDEAMLTLGTHTEEVYINLIGKTILEKYTLHTDVSKRKRVLRYVQSGLEEIKLVHFEDIKTCHDALKNMISKITLTGQSYEEYGKIFLSFYSEMYGIKEMNLYCYIRAYHMLLDFCNLINLILGSSEVVERMKNISRETIEIHRVLCISSFENIFRMNDKLEFAFTIYTYDENEIRINPDGVVCYKTSNRLMFPISNLKKLGIKFIVIKIGDLESEKIQVLNYVENPI